jgi:pimeloyl-ACP methyl ester carboxylesterase
MSDAFKPIAKTSSHSVPSRSPAPSRSSSLRSLVIGTFALTGLLLLTVGAQSAVRSARHETASRPHVYLMRGLMNIFSLGMDELAAKIERHGIAAGVYNHTQADAIVNEIAAAYRAGDHGPIILIGHSLGADAVMMMAQALNQKGVPVSLVIPFDGTGSYIAPKNVACVLNLTQREYAYMRAGSGFHGKLSNVDVSNNAGIDHFTIDKSPRLQSYALNSVLQAAHSESCRTPAGGPTVAKPTEPSDKHATPPLRPGIEG